MDFDIKHDKENQRFYLIINNKESTLKYKNIEKNTLDYYSTYVPEELREQGIAGKITEFALKYAQDNHYHILPSCPYVEKYIADHPEYQNLVRKKT